MQVEECWVLVGHGRLGIWRARMLRYRSGQIASVEADAAWVLKREETRATVPRNLRETVADFYFEAVGERMRGVCREEKQLLVACRGVQ